MSAEQVELLRDMYMRRTVNEFAESLHPEAEMHQAPEIPDTDVYKGREEFARGIFRWLEEWETFRYVPEAIDDLGDRILIRVLLTGRAKASGVELEQPIWHVWTFRDEQPFRCEIFFSEPDAREAAGLGPTSA